MMDINQLRYFQMAAKEQHITRAANKLFISQPALSAVLNRIEKELGVPLFNHVGRNIELNEYGKLLLTCSSRIIKEYDSLLKSINNLKHNENSTLHLGISGPNFLIHLIKDFVKVNPYIAIQQSIVRFDSLETEFEEKNLDFIIIAAPVESPIYNVELLWNEKLYMVVPPNHPLASKKNSYLEYFSHDKYIGLPQENAFRQFTDRLCQKSGYTPNVVVECFPGQVASFVRTGYGISIVPESAILSKEYTPDDHLISLMNEDCVRPINLIWPKNSKLRNSARVFLDFTRNYIKK